MKITSSILAVLFWYGSQVAFAGNAIANGVVASGKSSAVAVEAKAAKHSDVAELTLAAKKSTNQKVEAEPVKKDLFQQEIENLKKNPGLKLTPKAGGVGDYGGSDVVKDKFIKVRADIEKFLKKYLGSMKSIDQLKDDGILSDDTYQVLISEFQTEDNLKFARGLAMRRYLMGMVPLFVDGNCSAQGGANPLWFRVQDDVGYVCVSKTRLFDSDENKFRITDEQFASFLIHEALHYLGVINHVTAQGVGNDLAAAIKNSIIPDCKVNAGMNDNGSNALITESVPKCRLVIPDGEFLVSFYTTKYGKGFSLNDDDYYMTKQDVKYSYESSSLGIYLGQLDISKICPNTADESLATTLNLLSKRQIYARVLFNYWYLNYQKSAIVGLSDYAGKELRSSTSDHLYMVNFSEAGIGVGYPWAYRAEGAKSHDDKNVRAIVCLISTKEKN